jgi:dihydroxy-acid dehydratase
MLPMPKKLIKQGVKDMVRISDGRMSGTSYGTCVLHVAPEAYVGGPLALVKNGDLIELDVEKKVLNLKISESEFKTRKQAWQRPPIKYERSYGAIFSRHVKQANEGCDFDFLRAREGEPPQREPLGLLSGWVGGW